LAAAGGSGSTPVRSLFAAAASALSPTDKPLMWRRWLNLKATFEGGSSLF
jgi:hypothetical protein